MLRYDKEVEDDDTTVVSENLYLCDDVGNPHDVGMSEDDDTTVVSENLYLCDDVGNPHDVGMSAQLAKAAMDRARQSSKRPLQDDAPAEFNLLMRDGVVSTVTSHPMTRSDASANNADVEERNKNAEEELDFTLTHAFAAQTDVIICLGVIPSEVIVTFIRKTRSAQDDDTILRAPIDALGLEESKFSQCAIDPSRAARVQRF